MASVLSGVQGSGSIAAAGAIALPSDSQTDLSVHSKGASAPAVLAVSVAIKLAVPPAPIVLLKSLRAGFAILPVDHFAILGSTLGEAAAAEFNQALAASVR